MKQWYDLSVTYRAGMPEAAGHEKISLEGRVSGLSGSHITQINMNSHSGTHLDAPCHYLCDRTTIDRIPLEKFTGDAIVIDLEKGDLEPITIRDIEPYKKEIEQAEVLFIRTGWEERWGDEEYTWKYPYISKELAEYVSSTEIKIFGTDTISPDPSFKSGLRDGSPVHMELLSHDILIIENLTNLKSVIGKRIQVFAFPLKFLEGDGSPTRVVACEI